MDDYRMAGRSLKAVAVLQSIGAVAVVAAILIPAFQSGQEIARQDLLMLLLVFLPAFSWLVGRGVSNQDGWARPVAIVYCLVMLVGYPMGTLIGAYILFFLVRDKDDIAPATGLTLASDVLTKQD